MDKPKKENKKIKDENLSRKDWIARAGKYTVFTAASMMLILAPGKNAAAASPNSAPGDTPVW